MRRRSFPIRNLNTNPRRKIKGRLTVNVVISRTFYALAMLFLTVSCAEVNAAVGLSRQTVDLWSEQRNFQNGYLAPFPATGPQSDWSDTDPPIRLRGGGGIAVQLDYNVFVDPIE
jgi:hypothetical protein